MYIIGIDIGTTGCKSSVFDKDGRVMSKAYREYINSEKDGRIDADMLWEKTLETLKECTQEYKDIDGICTTSFGESVVPVDKDGKVLDSIILYTNANAIEEWKELDEKVGPENIAAITGHISHPMYTISRLMWIKKYEKEVYEQTEKFLYIASYIGYRLGAAPFVENSLAARSMAFDVNKNEWSKEIFDAAEVDVNKMADPVFAGAQVGKMSPELISYLGLATEPVIIAGGHDQPCVALGMGAIHGGDAAYGMGTVDCLTVVLDHFKQSPEMQKAHLIATPHVIEGEFITYGVLFSGGVILSDLRNKLYNHEMRMEETTGVSAYDVMMDEVPENCGELYYLPHLTGTGTPFMDTSDRGLLYGLTLDTTRGEIVRAALEGIAFDMRLNVENMDRCGLSPNRICACGGGAKSEKALQIRSNIIGKPLFVPDDIQAGMRGVFYVAAKSLGWIDSYEGIAKSISGRWIYPEEDNGAMDEKSKRFWNLYEKVKA